MVPTCLADLRRIAAAAYFLIVVAWSGPALAQSSGSFTSGQPLTADDLNAAFALKLDYLGYTPPNPAAANTWTGVQAFTNSAGVKILSNLNGSLPATCSSTGMVLSDNYGNGTSGPAEIDLFNCFTGASETLDVYQLLPSGQNTRVFALDAVGDLTLPGAITASSSSGHVAKISVTNTNNALRVGAADWISGVMPNVYSGANLASLSATGNIGVLGACRTSDSTLAGAMGCQGVTGVALNDNATQVQTGYPAYLEGRRLAGAGSVHSETDIINQGSIVSVTPYGGNGAVGMTAANWLSCGRGDVASSTDCSLAMGVVNNGPGGTQSPFDEGIMFFANSLKVTSGTTNAVDMPETAQLVWRNPVDGNVASVIRGDITNNTTTEAIVFSNASVAFQNPRGTNVMNVNTGGVSVIGTVSATTHTSTGATTAAAFAGTGGATISAGSATVVGTGGTVACLAGHVCDQFSGALLVTTGTSISATGIIVQVTLPTTHANDLNCSATIQGGTTFLAPAVADDSTSTFFVQNGVQLAPSTTYRIHYVCGGQ